MDYYLIMSHNHGDVIIKERCKICSQFEKLANNKKNGQ